MTTDEKAKAYDKVREKIVLRFGSNVTEEIFSESEESEDERIRKSLIALVRQSSEVLSKQNQESMIAWLEKQAPVEHFELKKGHWYICYRAYCCRADHLTVQEGERFECKKDGIVKGFVIKDPEKYFIEVHAPALMKDDQNDEVRRRSTIQVLEYAKSLDAYNQYGKEDIDKNIAWLEKQGDKDKLIKELGEYKVKYTQEVIENWMEQQKLCSNSIENEQIKKEIINAIHELARIKNEKIDSKWLAWLEKQKYTQRDVDDAYLKGVTDTKNELEKQSEQILANSAKTCKDEQKVTDKVEPTKFKVGDWVVYDHRPYQVVELPKEGYINLGLRGRNGKIEWAPSPYCRHWTIEDAKEGDVLDFDCGIGIFKNLSTSGYNAHCYCYYDRSGKLETNACCLYDIYEAKPTTKEQRDTLERVMTNAGYRWNKEELKLEKI